MLSAGNSDNEIEKRQFDKYLLEENFDVISSVIGATKNGVKASWIAVADGGDILDNDSMEMDEKAFEHLAFQLDSIELPTLEDDEMSRAWDIRFLDENDNEIKSIERGYWPIDKLEKIVSIIDEFLNNDVATEWLHNIIEA